MKERLERFRDLLDEADEAAKRFGVNEKLVRDIFDVLLGMLSHPAFKATIVAVEGIDCYKRDTRVRGDLNLHFGLGTAYLGDNVAYDSPDIKVSLDEYVIGEIDPHELYYFIRNVLDSVELVDAVGTEKLIEILNDLKGGE